MVNVGDIGYLCCGCGACAEVCPKGCIDMRQDFEGFYYPKVDSQQCIGCSKCIRACQMLNEIHFGISNNESYIARVKDSFFNIRLESSSGGVFSALACKVVENDGYCFGAAFNNDMEVCHISIGDLEEIGKLRGSKYVQSNTLHTFRETKILLEQGKTVLYSGTPCQIFGLKHYLEKDYKGLYTVDLLCHGVPSPKLWKHYVQEKQNQYKAKAVDVKFRDKRKGWRDYSLSILFDDGKEYSEEFFKNAYMRMFIKNISLRPSCYDCKYRDLNSCANITLGDCWGIESFMPEMDDDKGISTVLIHTEKGRQLFSSIKEDVLYRSTSEQEANVVKAKVVSLHKNRNEFFKALDKGVSSEELSRYLEPSRGERLKSRIYDVISQIRRS